MTLLQVNQNKVKNTTLEIWDLEISCRIVSFSLPFRPTTMTYFCPVKCQLQRQCRSLISLQHCITACTLPALGPTPARCFDITQPCNLTSCEGRCRNDTSLQLLHIVCPATKASERQRGYDYSNQRPWELLWSLKPSLPIEKHVLMHF